MVGRSEKFWFRILNRENYAPTPVHAFRISTEAFIGEMEEGRIGLRLRLRLKSLWNFRVLES